jgi:hypothetical protein
MRARVLPVVLAVLLGSGATAHPQASDPEIEKGIRQAQEGEFEPAIATLQGALPRLLARKAPPHDVARVHVYLGVARLGLGDPGAARASFLEALRVEPALTLSSEEYPPRILRAFEEARSAAPPAPATAAAPATAPAKPPAAPATTTVAKKGGSKLPLVLLGVGAVGGGVALAAGGGGGGGGSSTAATPTTPPPTNPTVPGNVNLVASFPPAGGTVQLASDPNAGSPVPEVTIDVLYGADVAEPHFEINLWRGTDLCFSSQTAYSSRLDSTGREYKAGTTARYRVAWWSARQPGCGSSFTTDRFEFFWGRPSASLFTLSLGVGWSFKR